MQKKLDLCKIYKIIEVNLGSHGLELYKEFYKDKNEQTIIASLSELLPDLIGKRNAKKQLKNLK
ncbi:hypothetical protein KJ632_01420 [Patescibacteria group bacterium]|nr:hypothetical protein [Patescibacteria group bacterium]